MPAKCCVSGCSNGCKCIKDGLTLHKFPNPVNDPQRFKTWLEAVGETLQNFHDNMFIYKNRRICHSHFEPKYWTRSKMLSFNAIPTLQMKAVARVPSEPLEPQDSQLPDSVVVCSQHEDVLQGDVSETESGTRQVHASASPSVVLVCMICLDTDGKMIPTGTHNLGEAYKKLTGYPLYDGGSLKQTLCVQCAQRLRNFSRFREQSLRARCLMMELLVKHESITVQHVKMIQHANNILRNNLVSTTLGPDPCDVYIFENCNEDRQTGSEETVLGVAVKTECSEDKFVDGSAQLINEENSYADCVSEEFDEDLIKYESAVFACTTCCEEFPHEHAYSAHVCTHPHDNTSDNSAPDSDHSTNTDLKSCVVKLYDIFKYPQNAKIKVESLPQIVQAVGSHDNAHTACEDAHVAATHNAPAASVLSETEPATSGHSSHTRAFTCDVCERTFTRKDHLVTHIRSHSGEKPYSCDICSYKCTHKSYLAMHMRTHTGERPYSCKICTCSYKQKGDLTRHMKTHTGEKPYSCDICGYLCARKYDLIQHIKKHTSEKPYSCRLCNYKFKRKTHLLRHMSTHSGEKSYSCEICNDKFTLNSSLLRHNMRIHSEEKPYSCTICSYKCTQKSSLVHHMKTHSGEKPYSCEICNDKFTLNSSLLRHYMRIHSGEKPYSCSICSYKCTQNSSLVHHMKTHSTVLQ